LLIQQRLHYSYNDFNRSWAEYKVGFNDSRGNYWFGNDLLSQVTMAGRYKLKFDLQPRGNLNSWYYAEYSTFVVEPESTNYRLQVSGYKGNAGGDSLSYANGQMFTTFDRDNDPKASYCAVEHGGGFWFKGCCYCCVNSNVHFNWHGLPFGNALQSSRMWLQCK